MHVQLQCMGRKHTFFFFFFGLSFFFGFEASTDDPIDFATLSDRSLGPFSAGLLEETESAAGGGTATGDVKAEKMLGAEVELVRAGLGGAASTIGGCSIAWASTNAELELLLAARGCSSSSSIFFFFQTLM